MLRTAVLRALAIAAIFAVVWLVPRVASAAIIPVCDADAFSGVLAVAVAPAAHANEGRADCAAPLAPTDEADPQIAAMCDAQGATAVAPGRIHPMTDARIDAVVTCDGTNVGPLLGPSHGEDHSGAASWALADHAVLSISYELRREANVELLPDFHVAGEPRVGFGREIDHPPRLA